MKIIFYHIPRTGGSSMWHSLANSFNGVKNLAILDTHSESIKRFNCAEHQEEVLKEFLNLEITENYLIHVHKKINFSDFKGIDYLLFGKRNIYNWRSSIITHFFIKKLPFFSGGTYGPNKFVACSHPSKCQKIESPRADFIRLRYALTDSIYDWIKFAVPKNNLRKYEVFNYNERTLRQKKIGRKIQKLLFIPENETKFELKRYGSDSKNLRKRGWHDSRGITRLLGVLVNFITFPIFIFAQLVKNR